MRFNYFTVVCDICEMAFWRPFEVNSESNELLITDDIHINNEILVNNVIQSYDTIQINDEIYINNSNTWLNRKMRHNFGNLKIEICIFKVNNFNMYSCLKAKNVNSTK